MLIAGSNQGTVGSAIKPTAVTRHNRTRHRGLALTNARWTNQADKRIVVIFNSRTTHAGASTIGGTNPAKFVGHAFMIWLSLWDCRIRTVRMPRAAIQATLPGRVFLGPAGGTAMPRSIRRK